MCGKGLVMRNRQSIGGKWEILGEMWAVLDWTFEGKLLLGLAGGGWPQCRGWS